jgi:hypothetical protein
VVLEVAEDNQIEPVVGQVFLRLYYSYCIPGTTSKKLHFDVFLPVAENYKHQRKTHATFELSSEPISKPLLASKYDFCCRRGAWVDFCVQVSIGCHATNDHGEIPSHWIGLHKKYSQYWICRGKSWHVLKESVVFKLLPLHIGICPYPIFVIKARIHGRVVELEPVFLKQMDTSKRVLVV